MLIDFSKEALTVPNNYLGADKKRTIIYKGEKYLLKFSNEIKNRSFNLTGKITRILGLRLSIILLPKLLRIYKTM